MDTVEVHPDAVLVPVCLTVVFIECVILLVPFCLTVLSIECDTANAVLSVI